MASITNTDAVALLAQQNIDEIIKPNMADSAALSNFRTIRMTAGQATLPVVASLPRAGWVTSNSDDNTDIKPTSSVSWKSKSLVAEEIAVIVPVHESLLADSAFDIWAEVQPLVTQEFGRVLDEAIFFGKGKPNTWTDPGLVPGAISAKFTIPESSEPADLATDINEAFSLVEGAGLNVNSVFTGNFLRAELRGLRGANGQFIYIDNLRTDADTSSIYGQPLTYVQNGAWNSDQAIALVGDASKVILGIREDVQVKLLDQATLGSGDQQINLAERDMVALRFKFRVAYALGHSQENTFPFAVVTPAEASEDSE